MKEPLYLDSHTTHMMSTETKELFCAKSCEYEGAISTPHFIGQRQIYPVKQVLKELYQALGLRKEDHLYLVSGNAEGVATVLAHVYNTICRTTGKTLLLKSVMEESVITPCYDQMKERGCLIANIPVDECGVLDKDAFRKTVSRHSALFSCSVAHALTGVIQPMQDVIDLCRDQDVKIHVDISTLLGKYPMSFYDLDVDFMTIEGSIIGAPLGTGLLISRSHIEPLFPGKELAIPSHLLALSSAIQEQLEQFEAFSMEGARLRDLLEEKLLRGYPDAKVLFSKAHRLLNCSCMIFPHVHAEMLLYDLHRHDIYASIGRFQTLVPALKEMGYGIDALSAISFSLSRFTTEEEICEAAKRILTSLQRLRKLEMG